MSKQQQIGIDGDVVEEIIKCSTDEIFVPDGRLRGTVIATVKKLAESIKNEGQFSPIIIDRNGNLIAGNHRLEACRLLGVDVLCKVTDELDADKLSLIEIDENLVRNELTATQLENHLAERKRIYNKLYPDTAKRGKKSTDSEGKKSFAEDTAETTGKSARTIERLVKRGEEASDELKEARDNKEITTSDIDNILKEAGTNPQDQIRLMKEKIKAKSEKKQEPKSSTSNKLDEQSDKLTKLISEAQELQKANEELKDKYEKKAQSLKKANETIKNLKDRIKRAKEDNPQLKI